MTKNAYNIASEIPKASHILSIDGETFPVYHLDRRLYKFVDWKDSRERLLKIMIKRIKEKMNVDTAFITFKMANPMRKSRLGNFFIDIHAEVLYNNRSLGTVEELGLKQIFSDNYETLDPEEVDLRKDVESNLSVIQYNDELKLRVKSLKDLTHLKLFPAGSTDSVDSIAEGMMISEGWCRESDNRVHARQKRISSKSK